MAKFLVSSDYGQIKNVGLPLWKPKDDVLEPNFEASIVSENPAPLGSCEYAGAECYTNSQCRRCLIDGFSCFLFADRVVYSFCPARILRLPELRKKL